METLPAGGHRVNLKRFEHGLTSEKHILREFFDSAEYLRIAELAQTLSDLMGPGAYIQRGSERQEVASFKAAMIWLFDQAKKGQTIQRYKGSSEMNADQLWETTINPDTRRLMQVRIEDAVATTDDIFTTLMGDAVGSRAASSSRRTRCRWRTSTFLPPERPSAPAPSFARRPAAERGAPAARPGREVPPGRRVRGV